MVQDGAHPAFWFQKQVPQVCGSVWTFVGSTVQQNWIPTHCLGRMTAWPVDFCSGENLSQFIYFNTFCFPTFCCLMCFCSSFIWPPPFRRQGPSWLWPFLWLKDSSNRNNSTQKIILFWLFSLRLPTQLLNTQSALIGQLTHAWPPTTNNNNNRIAVLNPF